MVIRVNLYLIMRLTLESQWLACLQCRRPQGAWVMGQYEGLRVLHLIKGVTMFDLFGLKAKKQVVLLRAAMDEARKVIDQKNAVARIVRNVAESLKARAQSHGMTDAEKIFMDECRDIFKNGKMISEYKFNLRMEEIKKQREALK